MRDGAILNPEQWTELDAVVVKTAKTVLTGRKFLDIYGPLGAGTEAIATDALPTPTVSEDFYGEGENAAGLGTRKVQASAPFERSSSASASARSGCEDA